MTSHVPGPRGVLGGVRAHAVRGSRVFFLRNSGHGHTGQKHNRVLVGASNRVAGGGRSRRRPDRRRFRSGHRDSGGRHEERQERQERAGGHRDRPRALCGSARCERRKFVLAFGKKSTQRFFSDDPIQTGFAYKNAGGRKKTARHEGASSAAPMRIGCARPRTSTRALRSSPTRWGARRARRCALAIGTTRTRRVTGRDRHRRWWSPWSRRPRAGGVMSWVRRDARHAAPRRRRRWSRPRPRLPAASPSRRRRGWRSRAPAPRAPRPRGPRR